MVNLCQLVSLFIDYVVFYNSDERSELVNLDSEIEIEASENYFQNFKFLIKI